MRKLILSLLRIVALLIVCLVCVLLGAMLNEYFHQQNTYRKILAPFPGTRTVMQVGRQQHVNITFTARLWRVFLYHSFVVLLIDCPKAVMTGKIGTLWYQKLKSLLRHS